MSSSVKQHEIEKFSQDAPRWWDERGPFAPLHRLNPARMGYIRSQICDHFGLDHTGLRPFGGLKILDIGCGGGLVCEPLARLGAAVTGIDADKTAIRVAREHAEMADFKIKYLNTTAEALVPSFPRKRESSKKTKSPDARLRGHDDFERFDVVLGLEIIEHVKSPQEFVKTCAALARPGGLVIFSTLNRTAKSFALGIVAAEYILNWVPRGTHDWKNFVRPSKLSRFAKGAGLQPKNISGLIYSPLDGDFKISKQDVGVNYFLSAAR